MKMLVELTSAKKKKKKKKRNSYLSDDALELILSTVELKVMMELAAC